jgi:hypothetical protein
MLDKVIEILKKPIIQRSAEQMNALDAILKTYSGFSKFPKQLRMKLAEKGILYEFKRQKVLIREKHVLLAVLFF